MPTTEQRQRGSARERSAFPVFFQASLAGSLLDFIARSPVEELAR
jgi:hypothetical protein